MGKHLGILDKIFIGPAGSTGASTELTHIRDAKCSYSRESVDVSDRASGEWGSNIPGKKTAQITWTHYDDESDATLKTIFEAWHTGSKLGCIARKKSGLGIDADITITDIEDDQTNDGASVYNVTATINADLRTPTPLTTMVTSGGGI